LTIYDPLNNNLWVKRKTEYTRIFKKGVRTKEKQTNKNSNSNTNSKNKKGYGCESGDNQDNDSNPDIYEKDKS